MVLANNTLRFIVLSILTLISIAGLAQNVEFYISAPTKVKVDQAFQLRYIVNGEYEQDVIFEKVTSLRNFKILFGPAYSKTVKNDIKDNVDKDTFSVTYLYTLKPNGVGKYTIPSVEINVGGRKYKSKPHQIEVSALTKEEIAAKKKAQETPIEDLFVRTIASRSRATTYDTLVLTYRLYTTMNVVGIKDTHYPNLNDDFHVRDITPKYVLFSNDIVNDIEYTTIDIQTLILHPLNGGLKKIGAGHVDVEYTVPEKDGPIIDKNSEAKREIRRLQIEDVFLDVVNLLDIFN